MKRLLLLGVLVLAAAGCADVGYNPYARNDSKKPIGKVIEDIPDSANRAIDTFDARFENAYH